ncbi:sialate O-acetylesterase [Mycobacterium sp. CBMA 234]|uniref:sialate O-acetylesterase n=1 Tax=Mycolicibacterium sp. CBMA 234 TaxID=1918495 RepID=UPI0012DCC097|nr:sialate O-acetylesterase [Mycolicibacterium sp. CBMA 234]MUL67658.1 sialate O-acetylesterase [Mycolicibacterium sp. CBMA 234]
MAALRREPRNPDGDSSMLKQVLIEAKCVVKRLIAPRGTAVDVPERPYLILPILGQSNAFGMGMPVEPAGLDQPHPLVHQWAMCGPSKGTVVLANQPLLHELPSKYVGFGPTFAKLLTEATGRPVLLIPGARGDTSFTPKNGHTWDPADRTTRVNLYHRAIAAIDAALARFPGSEIATVLWHQGETDVPLISGAQYQVKFDSLISDMRARYGSGLPFVLGQMVPEEMECSGKPYAAIDAVHADTPNRWPLTTFVPGPRESYNSPTDRHYSAAGQRELGRRMWQQYREMCGEHLAGYATG